MRPRDLFDLLRIPNVTTALSDIFAAWLLSRVLAVDAAGSPLSILVATAICSACLYSAGMALNDVADLERDRLERPERPIPSGRITRRAAASISAALFTVGLGMAYLAGPRVLAVAVILAVVIALYDFVLSGRAWLGPLGMASCRMLNLILGFVAAGYFAPPAVAALALMGIFIFALTHLSLGEVAGSPRSAVASAALTVAAVLLALVALSRGLAGARPLEDWLALAAAMLGLAWPTLPYLLRAARKPAARHVGPAVGAMVSSILWLDAALVLTVAPALWLLVFFGLGLVQVTLRRSFPVT